MKEYKLQPTIIENYRDNLSLIKQRMDSFVDPTQVPPDLVRSMINTEMIIEKESTDFSDADNLELLDRLEKWYTDQSLEFPNKEYLVRQRARYSN
ncbi:MAG: hypothetical protein H6772_01965 [Pseudomonadales bacterium]|nr:hypothetical protein [Pseudomonadales bacterium]